VGKTSLKAWTLVLAVSVCLGGIRPCQCSAEQFGPVGKRPSKSNSISSGFKQGMSKVAQIFKPKTPVKPAEDPVSLSNKAKPKAQTYVAVARLHEQSGKLDLATKHYKQALKQTPNYLGALLGLARVNTSLRKPDEALELYKRAAKAHPNEAAVYNNLGAFYGSRGMFKQSADALNRAIQLQPKQANYRANIAVVLVHLGRTQEAYTHLRAVQSEAVAYYNLGFLLKAEGQTESATQHFATAVRIDPSLHQAKYWLSQLQGAAMQARTPSRQPAAGIRVGNRPLQRPAPSLANSDPRSQSGQRPGEVRQLSPPPAYQRRGTGSHKSGPENLRPRPATPSAAPLSVPKRLPPAFNGPVPGPRLTAPMPAGSYRHRRATRTAPLPSQATGDRATRSTR
jgi:tetratricopeptide (TPR) repeat protein